MRLEELAFAVVACALIYASALSAARREPTRTGHAQPSQSRSGYTRPTLTRQRSSKVHVRGHSRRTWGGATRVHEHSRRAPQRPAPSAEPFSGIRVVTQGREVTSVYKRWQPLDPLRGLRCALQCGVMPEPGDVVRFYQTTMTDDGNRHVWLAVDRNNEVTGALHISEW